MCKVFIIGGLFRLSVKQLKDTIQLSLLQQSEYLRRFSLTFCQKVQEEDQLNKTGILKHVKEIISKLRIVSDRMSAVLEYHQALGLVPLHELDQKCLALKKQQSLDQVKVNVTDYLHLLFQLSFRSYCLCGTCTPPCSAPDFTCRTLC